MRRYKIEINQTLHVLNVDQQAPNRFAVLLQDGRMVDVALVDEEQTAAPASIAPTAPPAASR
ncbi:MAG: hypothetical protein LBI99_04965, partial [Propionibacteriaceae bacterium]|nr:hypothetical protein [Propionibacteriaceae bacterium]